ncbi:hypothetical protein [Prosthecobacter sp.]|uniref:hypothetical protein n=1 Tax=Prosthecobacter sp. TaxID=1965333 RepID=UPI003783FFEC
METLTSAPLVVQIVPLFFPSSCGVGDYARLIATEWRNRGQFRSRFLVADKQGLGDHSPEGSEIHRLARDGLGKLSGLAGESVAGLVLQYSGYGYARRGAPLWLVRTLKSFRRHAPYVPVMTMFHEVAAKGPVNTSAFWMRPLQLHVARQLKTLSDVTMTNCETNAKALDALSGRSSRSTVILPVLSNFGEPSWAKLSAQRSARMVVFTSQFGGKAPDAGFWNALSDAASKVGASEVTMIGRSVDVPSGVGLPVLQPGFLDAGEASAILAKSAFGYVFHGTSLLGKSGVFAAYAAHGVAPLIQTDAGHLPDGLVDGTTYYALQRALPAGDPASFFEKIRHNAWQWYLPHDLAATADAYAKLLGSHQFAE